MRSVPVAILLSTAFLLAGCSGGGDDGDDLKYVCANGTEITSEDHPEANATKAEDLAKYCPKSTTSGSRTNTTSQAPNKLPILVLNITDPGGNATNVTMLDGNLTFSAEGSTDPDGSVAGIAVTITDSNTTRTATLYDAGKKQFTTATFTFDRPGRVNVTVAMVDDRAGFTVNQTHVYVNHLQTFSSANVNGPAGPAVGPCSNEPAGPIAGASFFHVFTFTVVANATWIEASTEEGTIQICDPAEQPLGESGSEVSTPPGTPLPTPQGIESYYIGARASGPQTPVAPVVIVHYEPDTRAAA